MSYHVIAGLLEANQPKPHPHPVAAPAVTERQAPREWLGWRNPDDFPPHGASCIVKFKDGTYQQRDAINVTKMRDMIDGWIVGPSDGPTPPPVQLRWNNAATHGPPYVDKEYLVLYKSGAIDVQRGSRFLDADFRARVAGFMDNPLPPVSP